MWIRASPPVTWSGALDTALTTKVWPGGPPSGGLKGKASAPSLAKEFEATKMEIRIKVAILIYFKDVISLPSFLSICL